MLGNLIVNILERNEFEALIYFKLNLVISNDPLVKPKEDLINQYDSPDLVVMTSILIPVY